MPPLNKAVSMCQGAGPPIVTRFVAGWAGPSGRRAVVAVDKRSGLTPPDVCGRRRFLTTLAAAVAAGALGGGLGGCSRREPLLRIAANVFPGYELMFLAAARNYFTPAEVRMVSMPSATACLQALAAGNVEGAALTLDEVISARGDNMPLKVVAVLDISLGADVVLAKPGIQSLDQLKGKRIGVEQSAVGAVMLGAALSRVGLDSSSVEIVYATVDKHYGLFVNDDVDALVTFEPLPLLLAEQGAVRLFDSSMEPGLVVDVLVVRPDVVERSPNAIRRLVAGHFRARAELLARPPSAAEVISRRLGVPPAEVPSTYAGLELPDVAANRDWLLGESARLDRAAAALQQMMVRQNLLRHEVNLEGMREGRFLPQDDVV